MAGREPKFVVGNKPVNRRTAAKPGAPPAGPMSGAARERLRNVQARNRLGPPLAEQLLAPAPTSKRPLGARAVAGGMAAACGGLGLLLAWMQGSAAGGGAAAAALVGGLWAAWPRRPHDGGVAQVDTGPWIDAASVDAFDRALEAMAGEVPGEILHVLADIKALIARIARHPAAGQIDEHFRLEDRMYVNECLRRYLPDSLQAYLAVPGAQRAHALAHGQSAQSLLLSQLAMLQQELQAREAQLARSAAEGLLRQQRFLQAKAKR